MRSVEEIIEEAKRLPPQARRELRDMLDESLDGERRTGKKGSEGPYASLLRSAGTARSLFPDVSRNKNKHLAEIHAGKRSGR